MKVPEKELPEVARVVIIGGGIVGTSVAYHLGHMGWEDVVLLERDEITSGTTWHAAGLMVTYGSMSDTSIELRKYSNNLYARLEAETGQATGMITPGFIQVATSADRLEECRRVATFNRYCGIDVHEISPREVRELVPIVRTDDILAGFYVKEDGRINPVDVTMALAKGARMQGVKVLSGVSVKGVTKKNGYVTGVLTDSGTIRCEFVVNCAGIWARELGAEHGVAIPSQAAEHYYLVTDVIEGVSREWPILEDPSCYGYYREEGGGLMIGLFEPAAAPWRVEGIPQDFSFAEIEPDWERMAPYLEKCMSRLPISSTVGIKKLFCGPESFTPDTAPIVGEAPELGNYFVATGLNSIGINTGGGLGRVMAHWILNGRPDIDVTQINIDRFHPYQTNREYRRSRTVEALANVYKCHYPTKVPETGRGARQSVLHDRLVKAGAYFREVSGWEAADWYAPEGVQPIVEDLSWGRMNWWPFWQAEHLACRERVVLMDLSSMSKFVVQGRDAGRVLERVSANNVNGQCGRISYTQWLNHHGRIEADVTVIKRAEDCFMVIASDSAQRHVESWIRRHISDDEHAFVTDVTSAYTLINIQGPYSRKLLQSITTADLSNQAFPFRTAREIDIGLARLLCVRITYVGELGYELYISTDQAVQTYDRLVTEGKRFGLVHAGLRALGSLRLEKGYRDYGQDIDNCENPFEVGLGFTVALDKPGGFIGQAALNKLRSAGPSSGRLVHVVVLDPEPLLWHGEVLFYNGHAVGYVRAGSYGHTVGGATGLAKVELKQPVTAELLAQGTWEIDIAGRRFPCACSLRPPYDPQMERIKL